MDHEPITIESVRRLDVRPDDVVVVNVAGELSLERAAHLRDCVRSVLPAGTRIMVLPGGMEISVLSQADVAELAT